MSVFGSAPLAAPVCKVTRDFEASRFDYSTFFDRVFIPGNTLRVVRQTPYQHWKTVPGVLSVGGSTARYEFGRFIGEGSYGVVCTYTLRDGGPPDVPPVFCVKLTKDVREITAVNMYVRLDGRLKAAFPWRVIGMFEKHSMVVMPLYDDDLMRWATTMYNARTALPSSQLLNIGIQLLELLNMLWQNGLVYYDLKAENCLYIACGDAAAVPVTITLGDAGSIASLEGGGEALASKPPPEFSGTRIRAGSGADAMAVMRWAMGATLLAFVDPVMVNKKLHFNVMNDECKKVGPRVLRRTVVADVRRLLAEQQRTDLIPAFTDLMGTSTAPSDLSFDDILARFRRYEMTIDAPPLPTPPPAPPEPAGRPMVAWIASLFERTFEGYTKAGIAAEEAKARTKAALAAEAAAAAKATDAAVAEATAAADALKAAEALARAAEASEAAAAREKTAAEARANDAKAAAAAEARKKAATDARAAAARKKEAAAPARASAAVNSLAAATSAVAHRTRARERATMLRPQPTIHLYALRMPNEDAAWFCMVYNRAGGECARVTFTYGSNEKVVVQSYHRMTDDLKVLQAQVHNEGYLPLTEAEVGPHILHNNMVTPTTSEREEATAYLIRDVCMFTTLDVNINVPVEPVVTMESLIAKFMEVSGAAPDARAEFMKMFETAMQRYIA